MTTLFIDTSYDVTLGLLSDNGRWIDHRMFKGQKSSVILQPETLNLLKDHNLTPRMVTSIVTLAGPGFYTGLRLSEGFSDVFKFFQIPHYSFYSYEVPSILNVKNGIWVTKAYRGEYFIHSWDSGVVKNEMIKTADLEQHLKGQNPVYLHALSAMDEAALKLVEGPVSTSDLIQQNPEMIFRHVLDRKLNRESFYFRAPEDEFKANP